MDIIKDLAVGIVCVGAGAAVCGGFVALVAYCSDVAGWPALAWGIGSIVAFVLMIGHSTRRP